MCVSVLLARTLTRDPARTRHSMGKKGGGKKKKGGGETLRGSPPEEECQDWDEIRESGFGLYESLEQEQFNGSAPSYMKVLFRKEQDALRAMEEAENGGAAAKPAPKKTKVKKKKAEKEVVAEA